MKIKKTDLEPIEDFPLKWRWTDERWNKLPDEIEEKIRPLKIKKAIELHEFSSKFFAQYGLIEDKFIDFERFQTSIGAKKVVDWLKTKLRDRSSELVISWDKNTAILVNAKTFTEFWDDFCYPGSDDVSIFPLNIQWMPGYFHDEYFEFGRVSADPTKMKTSLITIAYIAASALFILSLGGLSKQETARRGNWYGIVGMLIALAATVAAMSPSGYVTLAVVLIPGALVGSVLASRVQMTSMPQLVAILHSFVGLAAVLVGFGTYLGDSHVPAAEVTIHLVEIFIGVCIGAVTFTGSVIAFLKLQGTISGRPLLIPGRHIINLLMLAATITLGVLFVMAPGTSGQTYLLAATIITFVLGVHFVMAIGGADMPVVVSMLNSYSGWAASAAGFMLSNDLLIITGALVGSSGAILSYIMCRGMNRSFINVMLGGFGTESGTVSSASGEPQGEVRSVDAENAASMLQQAKKVIIVPGYGLAVAQAQHSLAEVVKILKEGGTEVKFAIHPVAGRLPGHMNVLLAEANIPYDIVFEMEEINDQFNGTDVAWVIGANDIVNPSAMDDPASPIAGMPVLHVWEARDVIVMKRSMASGYAGVDNPLFYKENTLMLFGDAKKVVDEILTAMRA